MKKKTAKLWIPALLAVLALALWALTSCKEADRVFYVKDGQLWYSDLSGDEPYRITSGLSGGDSGLCLTEDGGTMFYLDKFTEGSGTLYRRDVSDPGASPAKIASGVDAFAVSEDGSVVVWLSGKALSRRTSEASEVIGRNVEDFSLSRDGETALFRTATGSVYLWNGAAEFVGGDIHILFRSTDLKTLIYTESGALYRKTLGEAAEMIASDVSGVWGIGSDGSLYYTVDSGLTLADFFTAKNAGEWTDALAQYPADFYEPVYYYNGEASTLLAEACSGAAGSENALYCLLYDLSALEKPALEDLRDRYYSSQAALADIAEEMVTAALVEVSDGCLFLGDEATQMPTLNISRLSFRDGTIYMLGNAEECEGDLYRVTLSGGQVGTPDRINRAVWTEAGLEFVSDGYFYYFKDPAGGEARLCVNGSAIEGRVWLEVGVRYSDAAGGLVYLANYSGTGTLKSFDGKDAAVIAGDVQSFTVTDGGNILYLSSQGGLFLYNGRKTIQIDEKVSAIFEN